MNKLIIGTLITLVLSLSGWLYIGVCDDIKEVNKDKADKQSIEIMLNNMKEQQKENKQDLKEQRQQQQKVNEQMYKSIQVILIKMAKE